MKKTFLLSMLCASLTAFAAPLSNSGVVPEGVIEFQDLVSIYRFENLLYGANVVCTPGVGFGPAGEGYVRFTAFGSHEKTEEALDRITAWSKK